MNRISPYWGLIVLVVGALQAWDSGALAAGPVALVLIALAIGAPSAALLLSASSGVQAASVLAMLVLLTGARLVAPLPLNGLHIMLVPAAFLVFTQSLQRGTSNRQLPGSR
jgi:hypothetical protein